MYINIRILLVQSSLIDRRNDHCESESWKLEPNIEGMLLGKKDSAEILSFWRLFNTDTRMFSY